MTTLNKVAAEVITCDVGAGARPPERVPRPSPVFGEGGDFESAGPGDQPRAANNAFPNNQQPITNNSFPVHAMTDITGFGLIGHLREMLLASENVSARIYAGRVPLLEGALECVRAGHIPGGLK